MHCFHCLLAAPSPASCKMAAAPAEGAEPSRRPGRGLEGGECGPSLLLGKVGREAGMKERRGREGETERETERRGALGDRWGSGSQSERGGQDGGLEGRWGEWLGAWRREEIGSPWRWHRGSLEI